MLLVVSLYSFALHDTIGMNVDEDRLGREYYKMSFTLESLNLSIEGHCDFQMTIIVLVTIRSNLVTQSS